MLKSHTWPKGGWQCGPAKEVQCQSEKFLRKAEGATVDWELGSFQSAYV